MTRRKTRRGGSAAKPPLYGIGAFDGNVYAVASSPSGTPGDVAGFWVSGVFRLSTLADQILLFTWTGSAAPWSLRYLTGDMLFSASDGVGSAIQSPHYLGMAAGAVYGFVGVYDGAYVRFYVQGAEVGAGTAITGHTPGVGGMYVGAAGATNNAIDWFGCAYGVGVPTAQNISDWWALTKSARAIQDMPGASPASRLWRPGATLGNVTDLVGSKVLEMGSPLDQVLRTVRAPVWG